MYAGIDVAKGELVVAVRPADERWSVANDERGVRTLVERLTRDGPALVVLEATGGYELAAVAALAAAGLPVVVANPRQVREFARATGQLAKTDRSDAGVLALFAERVRPEVRPLPDEAQRELDALLARRRQLLEMLTAERNRLGQATGRGRAAAPVKKSLKAHIEFLERELRMADTDLGAMVRESPAWRERDELYRSALAHAPGRAAGAGPPDAATDREARRGRAARARLGYPARAALRARRGPRCARCSTWRRSSRRSATRRSAPSTPACSPPASRRSSRRWRACGSCSRSSTRWPGATRGGTRLTRRPPPLDIQDSC